MTQSTIDAAIEGYAPPQPAALRSKEAEQSVLGGLLLDNGAIDRIAELKPEHFADETHRRIFTAISAEVLAGRPADVVTVHEALQAQGHADLRYLNALAQSVPSAANIRRYAKIVIDRHKARSLLAASTVIAELAQDGSTPIDSRIEQAQGELGRLANEVAEREAKPMAEVVIRLIDALQERSQGGLRVFPTGIADLDGQLGGGIWPGEVTIVAARPAMGKTAIALTAALHMAQAHSVGFLSMEMGDLSIAQRAAANVGRLDMKHARRPDQAPAMFWDGLTDAADALARLNLYLDDQPALTMAQVAAKARSIKRRHGLDVLVIDYLQLMSGTDLKQSRAYQLEEITRGLKALSKTLDIAVMVLAQVNRKVEGGMPTLADLKDSGAIEQDADVVMFVHRPIQSDPELAEHFKHFAKVRIAKQRQGENGDVLLSYIGRETRFAGWSGPEPVKAQAARRSKGYDE